MVRRLYLHIGMHKTGSTAIQQSLKGYDDGTTAYLKLADANHSMSMSMLFCEEQASDLVKLGWARSLADLRLHVADVRQRIQDQIASGRQNLIVSGEELSTRFGAREIARLRSFFAPAFDEIRVIVYLREPRAFMRSALQQIVKNRHCNLNSVPLPNYRRKLLPWENALGRDAMDYVLFAPDQPSGQDVVHDFASRVGLVPAQVTSKRANESMSAEAFAGLYRLRNGPPVSKLAWPAARLHAVGRKYQGFGRQRFALADTIWPDLTADQEAEIAWAEERLGRRFAPEPLRPDAVVFKSEAEILAFAAAHDAAFRRWARQVMPFQQVVRAYVQSLTEMPRG
jgi:hypothetical protein